jgi:hypothetical protein
VPSADPFWRGNLEAVRRLLEALGLTVNSFFAPEDTMENIRTARLTVGHRSERLSRRSPARPHIVIPC